MATQHVLMVLPNEHVKANKKLKLQAASIQELAAQVAVAVKLGEDAVLCSPTEGAPSASDEYTSLAEIGEKAKVMVWPARSLRASSLAAAAEEEVEEEQPAADGAVTLALVCPEDCGPGDTVAVEVDGAEIEVEIPDGVGPGDEFEVHLAPNAQADMPEDVAAAAEADAAAPTGGGQAHSAVQAERVLLVMPNAHVASSKKLKLQAASIQELAAQVAVAVKLGEDAVLCSPTEGAPSASDEYTSLAEIGEKAKVMVWPARSLRASSLAAAAEEEEEEEEQQAVAADVAPRGTEVPAPQPAEAEQPAMTGAAAAAAAAQDAAEATRSRMTKAIELEKNPDRLTELMVESMEFGDALAAERMAIQDRFEAILQVQEDERIMSRELESMEQAPVPKPKGLRRLSIAAAAPRVGARRLSLAVGGGKKEDLDAMAAMAAAAAEFDAIAAAADAQFSTSDTTVASEPSAAAEASGGASPTSDSSTSTSGRTRSPRALDSGPLDRACRDGNSDRAINFARENPGLLVEKNRQGMLPLHEILRHDAPIDAVRVLVELAPETLSIPNDNGRTAAEVATRGFKPNPALLAYLHEATEAYVGAKRMELEQHRRDEARSFILMVMPNDYVPVVKKLKLEAKSIAELTTLVGEAVNMAEDAMLCPHTDDGSTAAQYASLDAVGEKAKVTVWPASLLTELANGAAMPSEEEAMFAAAAGIVSARAAEEQDTRMIAEEEHKVFSELMAEELATEEEEEAQEEAQEELGGDAVSTADATASAAAATAALATALASHAQAEHELSVSRSELRELQGQLQEAQASATAFGSAAQQAKDELAESLAEASGLRVELDAAAAAAEEKEIEIAMLLEENSEATVPKDLYDKIVSDLSAATSAHQDQVAALHAAHQEKLSSAAEEAEIELAMLQHEKSEAEVAQQAVAATLETALAEASTLGAELLSAREKHQAQVSEHSSALAAHAVELESVRASLSGSTAEIEASLRAEMDGLRAANAEEVATLRAELSTAAEERDFEAELAQQKDEAHESELLALRENHLAATERLRHEVLQAQLQAQALAEDKSHISAQMEAALGRQAAEYEAATANSQQFGSDLPGAGDDGAAAGMGPILTDARKLGVPPTLRRQLRSVAAVQKLASGNDAVLSIATELAMWPAVRSAESARQEALELRRRLQTHSVQGGSAPPEGIPHAS